MLRFLNRFIFNQIKAFIIRHFKVERSHWVNRKYVGKNLENNIISVDEKTYKKLKHFEEAEHQIGRFLNIKKVLQKVQDSDINGDLVEFGTWQGQGLILFDLAINKKIKKKMVGIDSFEGLPESSTVWKKGSFSNTSFELVSTKLKNQIKNFSEVVLIQGWFNDPLVSKRLYEKVKNISIVHFDADLGSSTLEALRIIEPYFRNREQPIYFLFDDWGCHPNEVPDAFNKWLNQAELKYKIKAKMIFFTNLTRYYEITFENINLRK